jgi:hypothetical protein
VLIGCCAHLTGSAQTACDAVVAGAVDKDCAAALETEQSSGTCPLGATPVDAGRDGGSKGDGGRDSSLGEDARSGTDVGAPPSDAPSSHDSATDTSAHPRDSSSDGSPAGDAGEDSGGPPRDAASEAAPADPCAVANGGCDPNALCAPTGPTTDTCTCDTGYYGDGTSCMPCSVCATGVEVACTTTTNTVCTAPALVLLAATSTGGVVGDVYDGTAWAAPTKVAGTASSDDLAVAFVEATGHGVGLLHGTTNELVYTVWNGTGWSGLTQLNTDATQGAPTLAVNGTTVHAAYWGTDYKYYTETYTGAWTTVSQAVLPAGTTMMTQPCGPSPGVLAPTTADVSLVFVNGTCGGSVNNLYNTDLSGAAWSPLKDVSPSPSYSASQRPAVAALASGPELIVVYIEQGSSQLASSYRTAGVWSNPTPITNGLSNAPVALTALPGSGAVLAYQGTDGKLYTATFSGTTWGLPVAAFTPSVVVAATPTLAPGVGTDGAEMVYVDSGGALHHSRLVGGLWSMPVPVAPGMTGFVHAAMAGGG